ncbi:response regulator transcription factor [Streptococcus sp. FT1-106]|uniref:response regulator transcription factor n=1 Tax=Streptococcus sp. FT1-106 TaxID=3409994 RepID=UPI003BF4DDB9
MLHILLAEDDQVLQHLLATALRQEGYQVSLANDGQEALDIFEHDFIDFLITDVMMPKVDGYELIDSLRLTKPDLPILILTAKGGLEDKEKGFGFGADDYMVKPIQLKELILRVESLCRRARLQTSQRLQIGALLLDQEALTVTDGVISTNFAPKEFQVLYKLVGHPNKIFTRLDLLDSIWGIETDHDERVVDACIKKVRKKILPYSQVSIETVRGLGYKALVREEKLDG